VAAEASGELTRKRRGEEGRRSGSTRGGGDQVRSVPPPVLAAAKGGGGEVVLGPGGRNGIDEHQVCSGGGRREEVHGTSLPLSLKIQSKLNFLNFSDSCRQCMLGDRRNEKLSWAFLDFMPIFVVVYCCSKMRFPKLQNFWRCLDMIIGQNMIPGPNLNCS
jgi:hypothetical protein